MTKLAKTLIQHYGKDCELNIAMEECAELIQAINKMKRGYTVENYENLVGEIADVLICIETIKEAYAICDHEIVNKIKSKERRTIERLKQDLLRAVGTD